MFYTFHMNESNKELFKAFKEKGFGLLFADALHPTAYQEAGLISPTFFEQHNVLTGNFYDELDQAGALHSYLYAMFDDINIGHMKGFYAGYDASFERLINESPSVSKALTNFMMASDFSVLCSKLNVTESSTLLKRQRLKDVVDAIDEELNVAKSFMAWGCTRAGLWFETHALGIKKIVLSHLEIPSIKNTLPNLYQTLASHCCFEPAMKQILLAFYAEKKATPECLDTSPLFTLINDPSLVKFYPILFKPLYVDGMNPASSSKGCCLFDVNECSTHPKRLGLSAIGFALKQKQIDIAYALFRSKAQFSREEFAQLVHLSICELDPSYSVHNINKLSNNTFQRVNEMLESGRNNVSAKHSKRFRLMFHAWLVRGSDLDRQQLFVYALDRELLTLAMLLCDKEGVNINSVSQISGKTLLHEAVERNKPNAVLKICANAHCNLNQLDNENKHALQLSTQPLILAPLVYYLLVRSGDSLLTFLARKIQELLMSHTVTYSHEQSIDLIAEVRRLVLTNHEVRQ